MHLLRVLLGIRVASDWCHTLHSCLYLSLHKKACSPERNKIVEQIMTIKRMSETVHL
jgi:hypothetical protein